MNTRLPGGVVAAVSLALLTSACGSDAEGSGGTALTFAGFGGALQESQTTAWFEPYASENDITIDQTDNTGVAALQTQIDSGNVQWDVVQDAQFSADAGCGTLYEEIPDVDRSQIDPEFITNDCGVPIVKFSFVLAYNSATYPTPPTSIGDLVNVEDFPGARGVSDLAVNGPLEAALLGDGVSADALYPLDYERAIDTLSEVEGDLVFNADFAVIQEGLASGNLDMALLPNGRAYQASKVNPDIAVAWGSAVTLFDNAVLVKGAPNAQLGEEFLTYLAQPETQSALSNVLPYGVLSAGAPPELPEDMAPFFPDDPEHADGLLYQDQAWWAENQDAVNEAWTSFISG